MIDPRDSRRDRDLRGLAEELMPEGSGESDRALSEQDKDSLIHELRVHQIELGIQNEELRHAQQELEESRDAYLNLYNRAPVGYLTLDHSGTIRRHNETVLDLIGDAAADLRGQPFHALLNEATQQQFLARFRAFFSQPEGKNLEVQLTLRGVGTGGVRDVRLTGRSIVDGGKEGNRTLLLAVTDITQQKQSERRIQALLQEKELLMKEVHHRVKNNLNTVMSMLNLQAMYASDSVTRETIQNASGRVRTMYAIYELLQEDVREFREVDLREYLTVLLSRIAEEASHLRVIPRIVSIRCPTRQAVSLGIILNELVTDAYKHAFPPGHDGQGQITVTLEASGQDHAVLTVEDNGVGMGAATAESIAGGVEADSGGFGLLLVRSQVEQMKGTFIVESADPGTRFRIRVPLEHH